jgi:O-antigen/teichoic acid export membrane protein
VLQRISGLFKNLAIYGLGDVATSIVSFLLLPIYVRFLSPVDYGAIGLLLSVEVVAKIVFRWGVDASFMRFYYDCETDTDRQRLASTIFWFLGLANGALLVLLLAAAPLLSRWLFGGPGYELPLRLVLANTFVIGFYFLPFHVLRIRAEASRFATLTFARAAATLVARLMLIVGFGLGVLGFVLADLVVTTIFTLVLLRWFAPLIRPFFSGDVLRDSLRFGLPRVPHGVAQQIMAVADRYLLSLFAGLREVGLYSIGASFGLAMKLFLSAFEYAWAPFYFSMMKEPDAKATFRTVATYGVAVLVLLEAGLAAIARDIVRLMTTAEFEPAFRVIPWIGLGVVFQGVYLLTSIGLNITQNTRFYPVATAIAAATSVTANIALVPRLGATGAGMANALAYAIQAGVAWWLSQRVYPVPLEYGRMARLAVAGLLAWLVAASLPQTLPPAIGVLARGGVVCALYPAFLWMLGFYDARELRTLARLASRLPHVRPGSPPRGVGAGGWSGTASIAPDEPIESAGAIVEVPLAQDDLPFANERGKSGVDPRHAESGSGAVDVTRIRVRPR